MQTRLIIAYSLIAALLFCFLAFGLWLRHKAPTRVHARGRKRQQERHREARAAKEQETAEIAHAAGPAQRLANQRAE